jgi:maltose/moltooligosaccharide transporter
MSIPKPKLSFWQIVNMNFGFFGIQYSFGLQQSNMSPIYSYLGAMPRIRITPPGSRVAQ